MDVPDNPADLIGAEALPEILPDDPMPLARAWFEEAIAAQRTPNPNAIALATADQSGNPSARIVLCKHLDELGYLVFYTNRDSRKGRELAARPRAAAVLHLDHFERQIRVEGPVLASPDAESDAYFATRSPMSRIGAWASDQSRPIGSREELLAKVAATMERLGIGAREVLGGSSVEIPRPSYWGGFRLWFERVELWAGGTGRVHDRAEWVREVQPSDGGGQVRTGPWRATRLQP